MFKFCLTHWTSWIINLLFDPGIDALVMKEVLALLNLSQLLSKLEILKTYATDGLVEIVIILCLLTVLYHLCLF